MNEELNKIKIAIIDDKIDDANTAIETIELEAKQYNYSVESLIVTLNRDEDDKDINKISEIIDKLRVHFEDCDYGILIIDFKLSTDIARYGSSLALRIREEKEGAENSFLNKLAIIGISSSQPTEEGRTQLREMEFIQIFDRNELIRDAEAFFKLAEGYSFIVNSVSEELSIELLCTILNTREISELLWNTIPEDFKNKWDPDTPHLFSRWLWVEFLCTPGFLLSKIYASTLLGITEEAFEKITDRIEEAKYDGVFKLNSRPLWWKEKLIKLVSQIVEPEELMPIWKRGRKLSNEFSENDYAKCAITDNYDVKLVPAYKGYDRQKLVPITYTFTEEAKNESISLGFDAERIWNGESE